MTSLRPLGSSRKNKWSVNETNVSFVRPTVAPRPLTLPALPQTVELDLARTALLVIDMQNDFCHSSGWLASIGVDITPARSPISPLQRLRPLCRKHDIPIIWINWGNRPDRLNLGPSTLHTYDFAGHGTGIGSQLPNGAHVLERNSQSAALVSEFDNTEQDIHIDKYSMSGFWDTPLQTILQNLGITTLLFAGVNLDQCVLATLQDASFRGYDCILLEDCSATTSPPFCTQAALYNIRQCFGFTATSPDLTTRMETLP